MECKGVDRIQPGLNRLQELDIMKTMSVSFIKVGTLRRYKTGAIFKQYLHITIILLFHNSLLM